MWTRRSRAWAAAGVMGVAAGIAWMIERPAPSLPEVVAASGPGAAPPAVAVDRPAASPATLLPREADVPTATRREAPAANAIRGTATSRVGDAAESATALPSEAAFLSDLEGRKAVDMRPLSELMRGEGFSDFVDRLALEASTSPLAHDIAELYGRSAGDADAVVEHAVSQRLVCGMNLCVVTATAPSKEVFDAWFRAFIGNPSARPQAMGRHDKPLDDGSFEYRLVFSNDSERRAVYISP